MAHPVSGPPVLIAGSTLVLAREQLLGFVLLVGVRSVSFVLVVWQVGGDPSFLEELYQKQRNR